MDIYKFINSKDVREHLRKINYEFNALEAIWLIYNCDSVSFEEKKKAYFDILDNFPDMPYENMNNISIDSVHKAIIEYVGYIDNKYKEFIKKDDEYYFTARLHYKNRDTEPINLMFKTYDELIKYIKDNKENYCYFGNKINGIKIPEFFDEAFVEKISASTNKYIGSITLTDKLELKYLTYSAGIETNSREYMIMFLFIPSMSFDFPIPFKKGDIVYDKSMTGQYSKPFILNGFINDQLKGNKGERISMEVDGYFVNDEGTLYYDVLNDSYINLEYYKESLADSYRVLTPLSNYLKGKLEIELCLNGYHQILLEEISRKSKLHSFCFSTKLGLIDSGVESDPDIHIKLWLDDVRPAPDGYYHCHSVNEMITKIYECERNAIKIDILDLDHDLGEFAEDGGDGIKLIDYLVENEKYYPIKLHTMNPIGYENMKRSINHYFPKELHI